MNIGEICNRTVVFAYKNMSVSEAVRLMREQHVGSLDDLLEIVAEELRGFVQAIESEHKREAHVRG